MALKPMMAEMFGKATGIGGGRGGEMHAADPAMGILGGNGIVGGGIPYAAGAAYSAVLDGSDRVSVAFFGDGASNQGSFHETLNIASAWNLPMLFVCENNLYAEMTPFRDTVKEVADLALGLARTYRWGGHFQGDPCKYRTREEEAVWQANDPVRQFREVVMEQGSFGADELAALEAGWASEITEAIDYALASPDPVPESALQHVYAP